MTDDTYARETLTDFAQQYITHRHIFGDRLAWWDCDNCKEMAQYAIDAIKAQAFRELAARAISVWQNYVDELTPSEPADSDPALAYLLGKSHAYANAILYIRTLTGEPLEAGGCDET